MMFLLVVRAANIPPLHAVFRTAWLLIHVITNQHKISFLWKESRSQLLKGMPELIFKLCELEIKKKKKKSFFSLEFTNIIARKWCKGFALHQRFRSFRVITEITEMSFLTGWISPQGNAGILCRTSPCHTSPIWRGLQNIIQKKWYLLSLSFYYLSSLSCCTHMFRLRWGFLLILLSAAMNHWVPYGVLLTTTDAVIYEGSKHEIAHKHTLAYRHQPPPPPPHTHTSHRHL